MSPFPQLTEEEEHILALFSKLPLDLRERVAHVIAIWQVEVSEAAWLSQVAR